MSVKKRIYQILEILRLSKEPFIFLGSYNNPDFKHFSDVDVDLVIDRTPDLPIKIKNLLERIKKQGPNLGFKFLELKFGVNEKYFKSNYKEDYERRFNKRFNNLDEAKAYAKEQYTNKITDINVRLKEIEKMLRTADKIKLDILVESEPNFTIEIMYKFKQPTLDGFINVYIRDLLDDIELQKSKGDWMKVAKRLYSITKLSEDDKRKDYILDIINKYIDDVWLIKTLDLPQSKEWTNYVKSKNIDIDDIQNKIREELNNNLII